MTRFLYLLTCLIFLSHSFIFSQEPPINIGWSKVFKGSAKAIVGQAIALDNNHLFFLANDYNSQSGSDFYTAMLDLNGQVFWSDIWSSGQGHSSDIANQHLLIKDDCLYAYGKSYINNGFDFRLIGYNQSGQLIFNQAFDWGFNDLPGTGLVFDDAIVIAGYNDTKKFGHPQARTISVASDAGLNWDFHIDGDFFTSSEVTCLANDQTYLYQAGHTHQSGPDTISYREGQIYKLDKNGQPVWSHFFRLNRYDILPEAIHILPNGDPLIIINVKNQKSANVIILRLDSTNGKNIWSTQLDLAQNHQVVFSLLSNGSLYVLTNSSTELALVKLNAHNGKPLWRQPFTYPGFGKKIALDKKNGLYLLVTINNQVGLLYLNQLGRLITQYFYPTDDLAKDMGVDFVINDNNLYLLINRLYAPGSSSIVANLEIGITSNQLDQNTESVNNSICQLQPAFPNPFNSRTTIVYKLSAHNYVELAVYNLHGQKIAALVSGYQPAGQYTIQWEAAHLPSGVYFYLFKSGNQSHYKKMILQK